MTYDIYAPILNIDIFQNDEWVQWRIQHSIISAGKLIFDSKQKANYRLSESQTVDINTDNFQEIYDLAKVAYSEKKNNVQLATKTKRKPKKTKPLPIIHDKNPEIEGNIAKEDS